MSVGPGLGARSWNGRQLAQEELTAVTISITVTVMVNVFETTIGLFMFICRPLSNIHSRIQLIFKWLCFLYPQPKWWDFKFNLFEFHPLTMSDEQRFKQAWNAAALDIINVKRIRLDTCLLIQTERIQAHVEQRWSQWWGWEETCSPWWRGAETDQDGDTPDTFITTALVSRDNI